MQRLDRLKSFYNFIELQLDDCPVRFSVVLPSQHAMAQWTNFPMAALPSSGRVAHGRGLTQAQCLASGLGEAVELASCCAWGGEDLVHASAAEIGVRSITAECCVGLTGKQYDERDAWNAEFGTFDWRPRRCTASSVIAWMAVCDAYSGEPWFAPADAVLIGRREAGDEEAVAIGDSNGCASGPSLEAAKAAAVLELIERDALGRWWYGRRGRPAIRGAALTKYGAVGMYLASRVRTCRVFDITTDIGIPAFAAVSAEPDGSDVALGSAAALSAGSAVLSALTEMLQMEVTLNMVRETNGAPETWGRWRQEVCMSVPPLSANETREVGEISQGTQEYSAAESLERCLAACSAANISLYFAGLTRSALGVPAVRALSADLCHFKPRFARPRLLAEDSNDGGRTHGAHMVPNPVNLLV